MFDFATTLLRCTALQHSGIRIKKKMLKKHHFHPAILCRAKIYFDFRSGSCMTEAEDEEALQNANHESGFAGNA